MIVIDTKLPSYKSYLGDSAVNSGSTSKTSIDQSAIGNTEQTNVALDLSENTNSEQEKNEKKKKEDELAEEHQQKKEVVVLSHADNQKRNLKLLNLL
jgi:hypothetical protein